ncbi:hypothetical protein ElyMa_000259800 [Elysia marginata]|uniref:Uncharacterized protein n=1 Tax=Elysia marginata TaxID=1093978 RepID=A0AAV4F607_9GAST|nr:hypothetical protein ElyMa_000259800 [Elysia marginata]
MYKHTVSRAQHVKEGTRNKAELKRRNLEDEENNGSSVCVWGGGMRNINNYVVKVKTEDGEGEGKEAEEKYETEKSYEKAKRRYEYHKAKKITMRYSI